METNDTEPKTFDVELFIHAGVFSKKYTTCTGNMSKHGYILLGTQTVTLNVPTKNPIEAELEMLDKKESSLIEKHLANLHTIQQRRNDLLCLEVKDD